MRDRGKEGPRSAAEIAWNLGLSTPSLVLISIPWCFPLPGEGPRRGRGVMEIWEPPACEVCCKGFPSNYNSIDGGGISREQDALLVGAQSDTGVLGCI